MDNHKPVTISIFGFLNMKKMQFLFFWKICLKKNLGFGRMHENNFFLWNISEKTGYFNTGFVFHSVNIQPDIMEKW
jgi:hypothetical protein